MTQESDQLALVRQLRAQNAALSEENANLKHGGGGGTLPPMDVVDAKIAASEARTDTKFAKLEGKLDLILEKVDRVSAESTDAKSEARQTRRTVIGTGISLAALCFGAFAVFSSGFNIGARVQLPQTAPAVVEGQAPQQPLRLEQKQAIVPTPAPEQSGKPPATR